MDNTLSSVESFIRDYARNISAGNGAALLAQFADPFLAAMPQGAKVVSVAEHAKALPGRREFFERSGFRSTSLVSLHPIPLSSRYTLALTKWSMTFAVAQGAPREILLDSALIVDTGVDPFKIILYLAAEDLATVLKDNGIMEG
ncbi:MAG: hypothetical protein ABSF23_13365 [Terracidiphilus sp.]|jgi:hypothetical protein